jgi:hypothetical protein
MRMFAVIAFVAVYAAGLTAAEPTPKPKDVKIYSFNEAFFSGLAKADPIVRDLLLSSRINTVVECVDTVVKMEEKQQYHKKLCIVASLNQQKILLTFNIYTENSDYMELMQPGQKISFKGQCVAVTPLGSKRDAYMIDIILEDGAAVVE